MREQAHRLWRPALFSAEQTAYRNPSTTVPRSNPPDRQQPALHPTYLRLLCALLAQRDIDPEPLLAVAGLTRRSIDSDVGLVAWAQVRALIEAASERSDCPWLGLVFGAAAQLHTHGMLGTAVISSGTLDAALRTVSRYAGMRTSAVRLVLEHASECTSLRIEPAFDLGSSAGFMIDALLVIIERMLEALSGRRLRGARHRLPQPPPAWAARYREFLVGEVEFDAPGWPTMTFERQLLDRPCLTADPAAHARAVQECERELEQMAHGVNLASRVRTLLLTCGENYPTAAEVAQQLHVSPRTLFRQLAGENSSYRGLLDRHRNELACGLLESTDLAVERIAERLGYADPSNFSRTFRRWNGVNPREFRRGFRRAG
jgi:AraC-like DNA-binding protein